jgi:hypothetical protein
LVFLALGLVVGCMRETFGSHSWTGHAARTERDKEDRKEYYTIQQELGAVCQFNSEFIVGFWRNMD